jgi:hypothetical protein
VYEKHFAGISRNKIANVHAIKFSKFINVIYWLVSDIGHSKLRGVKYNTILQ